MVTLLMVQLSLVEFLVRSFNGAEPVTNFNKPNGGLEVFKMNSTPQPQSVEAVAKPLEENFMNFVHSEC
jgi:hypothetical protein